jgi:hypothetical protein
MDAPIEITIPAANLLDSGGQPYGQSLKTEANPNARIYINNGTTLSGTIDLRLDGNQFSQTITYPGGGGSYPSYGYVSFCASENLNSSFADTSIQSDGSWSVTIPSGYTGPIYAGVNMPDSAGYGSGYFPVGQYPGSGPWTMGRHDFVSLTGTTTATINGVPFVPDFSQNKYIYLNAFDVTDPTDDDRDHISGGQANDSSGAWRVILPSVPGPRQIMLRAWLNGISGEYDREPFWQGSVTNQAVNVGALPLVFQTVSGTIGPVTIDSTSPDIAFIAAVPPTHDSLLGDTDAGTAAGSPWEIDVGAHSGAVKFIVGGYSFTDTLVIMAPALTSPTSSVDGSTGASGVNLGAVAMTTRNVSVTVVDGSNPVPCLVGITLAPLTFADMYSSFPAHKIVTVPYGSDYGMPPFVNGARTIPVVTGHSPNLHFIVWTAEDRFYVTNSPVNTSGGSVTLNLTSMSPMN